MDAPVAKDELLSDSTNDLILLIYPSEHLYIIAECNLAQLAINLIHAFILWLHFPWWQRPGVLK